MKKGLLLIIVLVILAAGAPFGFSFWADVRLNALLDDLNKGGVIDFTVIKKQRGWLSSEALVSAEVVGDIGNAYAGYARRSGNPDTSLKTLLKAKIYHGPFPITDSGIKFAPVIATVDSKFVRDIETQEPLINVEYSIKTHLTMAGGYDVDLDIPEWSGPMGNGKGTVEWKGLTGTIGMASGLSKIDMNIKAPALKIDADDGNMLIEALEIVSNSYDGVEGLALGEGRFSLGKLLFQDNKSKTGFELVNTSMEFNTGAEGDNVHSDVNMKVADMKIAGQPYGPLIFNIGIKNLDAGAIARINKKVKELKSNSEIPPEQVNTMLGFTVMSELSNILKKGPILEISELSLASKVGKLLGTAKVSVDTSRPELLSNPFLVKNAVVGEVDLQVPEELLVSLTMGSLRKELQGVEIQYSEEQLQAMARSRVNKRMKQLTATNFFIKSGNMYKFSASIKEGIPTVNGQPFQMPGAGPRPQ